MGSQLTWIFCDRNPREVCEPGWVVGGVGGGGGNSGHGGGGCGSRGGDGRCGMPVNRTAPRDHCGQQFDGGRGHNALGQTRDPDPDPDLGRSRPRPPDNGLLTQPRSRHHANTLTPSLRVSHSGTCNRKIRDYHDSVADDGK